MSADLSATGGTPSPWVRGNIPEPKASAATVGATLRKTSPSPLSGEIPEVRFAFNPERITVSHTYKVSGVTGTSQDEQIRNLGYVEIGIDKVYVTGEETKATCDALIAWSKPVTPVTIGLRGGQRAAQPVVLLFAWGASGLSYQVSLRQVTVAYVRFAAGTGRPIRAEVRLNLYENKADLPATNPTSGGPPGRSTRVLDSSECLASLAAARYGRPGAWRRIARANGVDDPLRVRPGTLLYLPEPGEAPDSAGGNP